MIRRAIKAACRAALLLTPGLLGGAAPGDGTGLIEGMRLAHVLPLRGEIFHVQGIEVEGDHIWVTSVDRREHRGYLHRFDRESGRLERRLEVTDGVRYHPGGISIANGSIWVPVAEMRPDSSAVLMEIDAKSFKVRRRIYVADHLGCVAASGSRLIAGNWNSSMLYIIDLTNRRPMRAVPNPSATHYQDMKFVGDQLVAGGSRSLWSGTLDWIDVPTMTVTRSLRAGSVGPVRPFGRGGPYTGEGVTIDGRDVYVLPEDGPGRVYRFRLLD
ncbi:MAG: DUF6454 family protein [Sphingomonas bacterium]|nr:DUF6454 family protein [Sphingomonas bacterium]